MESEKIICSAIWYKELPLVKEEVLRIRGFSPTNVDRGIVFAGHRHPHCLYQMVAITGKSSYEAGKNISGFLTNLNRFVDREEGAKIHIANGGTLNYSSTDLYSEDLY